jgi:anaerobic ribonucleoside-triphosphate reductase
MYYRPKIETVDNRTVVGRGTSFERTRRITGYLVGSLERFSNAKRFEEKDRVKHSFEKV